MRKELRSKIFVSVMAVLFSILQAFLLIPLSAAGLKDEVSEKVLPNGLKVILLENHKAPLVTFQIWYRVGSRNEKWGKTGLSHMLEHMMFKGTKKYSADDFSRIIQENGGNNNAFTSNDSTTYFETLSSDRVQVPLDIESDRMVNLIFHEEDFRTERMVVMEERRMRTEDNPATCLFEQLEATAFQLQPYHWPTIGWAEDIKQFTLEDLKSYYRIYYNPANAFIVAVGDFNKNEFLQKIEKSFGSIPKGTVPDQKRDIDPPQIGERRIFVKKEAQLPLIIMGYHVPNLHEPDSYVLEVIATILSSGKSSRFYHDLVQEKQLVLEADAEHSLLSHDPDLFIVSAKPLPGKDAAEVEKELDKEIERLQKDPADKQELQKATNQIEASFIFRQDSIFYQAMLLAQHEISADWKSIDNYLSSIRKVSEEDIRRVASKYLVPDNRTVAILIPLPPEEGKSEPVSSPLNKNIVR